MRGAAAPALGQGEGAASPVRESRPWLPGGPLPAALVTGHAAIDAEHGQLLSSMTSLRRIWGGIEGERLYDRLRGVDVPVAPTRRGSIGHSHVLPPTLRYDQGAYAVLSKLTQKAARRMRAEGYLAQRLEVWVDWRNRDPWVVEARFNAMDDTLGLLRVLDTLWAERPRGREPVKVGVVLKELAPASQSALPLFPGQRTAPGLDTVLDRLHQRFGNDAIYFGGAFRAQHEAPMRISFNHIPDPELEEDSPADSLAG